MKHALFAAYFTDGRNPGDVDVLVDIAQQVGLDGAAARDVIVSGRYADEVRAEERHWTSQGITAVPAVIIDGKYVILGGQPPAAFERALRSIAGEA